MNWHRTAANLIYVLYMVVNMPLIYIAVAMLPQDNYWLVVPAAVGIFIYIAITLGIVYNAMPVSISKYWCDDYDPKKDSN